MEISIALQKDNTETIHNILNELKDSVRRIEDALYNKDDLFKKTMYEVGIWAIKASILVGGFIWLSSQYAGGVKY